MHPNRNRYKDFCELAMTFRHTESLIAVISIIITDHHFWENTFPEFIK